MKSNEKLENLVNKLNADGHTMGPDCPKCKEEDEKKTNEPAEALLSLLLELLINNVRPRHPGRRLSQSFAILDLLDQLDWNTDVIHMVDKIQGEIKIFSMEEILSLTKSSA